MIKNLINCNPYIIAEISSNHNSSITNAKKLILDAKKYGAHAVKLQTFTPDAMTIKSNRSEFKIKSGLWKGKNLWDLYSKCSTPYVWHKILFDYAKKIGITCFSSPFDAEGVNLLEKLNIPFYKIASPEINHIPLIKKISRTKKTIVMSTGMASIKEIDLAYKTAINNGAKNVILLYCVSKYPAVMEDYNFNNIKILKERYKCKVGFSDHSVDNKVATAAIIAGAEVLEKHIALKNQPNSPDYEFSLKGVEIKDYITNAKEISSTINKNYFYRSIEENKNLIFRRSIYAVQNIKKGEIFSEKNIKIIRPALGLEPRFYERLIDKKAPAYIKNGTPLKHSLLKALNIKLK
jgi:hypothetical protein